MNIAKFLRSLFYGAPQESAFRHKKIVEPCPEVIIFRALRT